MNGACARVSLLIVAMLGFAGIAAAAETNEVFLKDAIEGNLGKVAIGELAQKKGATEAVKRFGATLEKDQAAANRTAVDAAMALGVTPPNVPGVEQKKQYQRLAGLSGTQFDESFVKEVIADDRKDIREYRDAAGDTVGEASSYARKSLPDLRKHLAMAERIESTEGATTAAVNR